MLGDLPSKTTKNILGEELCQGLYCEQPSFFALSMVHEIKTPLASISLLAQNLHLAFVRLNIEEAKQDSQTLRTQMVTLSNKFLQDIKSEVSSVLLMMNLLMSNIQ